MCQQDTRSPRAAGSSIEQAMRHDALGGRGFTLIELLIAITMVAMLASLLAPVLSLAQRGADRQNTLALMRKVDAACQAFKRDVRAFPWDGGPADPAASWSNDLAYRLSHDLTDVEQSRLDTDIANARAAIHGHFTDSNIDQPKNPFKPVDGQTWVGISHGSYDDGGTIVIAAGLRRLATERAAVAIMSGNILVPRFRPSSGDPWVKDAPIIAPQSRGWCADYLAGQIDRRDFDTGPDGFPGALLDRRERPLVYINPTLNGVDGFIHQETTGAINTAWFGLHTQGRSLTTSMDSDIRTTAAGQFLVTYELWSAGPDAKFEVMRNAPANRDNIPLTKYIDALR